MGPIGTGSEGPDKRAVVHTTQLSLSAVYKEQVESSQRTMISWSSQDTSRSNGHPDPAMLDDSFPSSPGDVLGLPAAMETSDVDKKKSDSPPSA